MKATATKVPKLDYSPTDRSDRENRTNLPSLSHQLSSGRRRPARLRFDPNPSFLNDSLSSKMVIQESRDHFFSRLSGMKKPPGNQTEEHISIDCDPVPRKPNLINSSSRLLGSIRERVKLRNTKKSTDIKEYLAAICSFPEQQGKFEVDEKTSLHKVLESNFKKRDATNRRRDLRSLATNPSTSDLKIEVASPIGQIKLLKNQTPSNANLSVDSTRLFSPIKKLPEPTAKFPASLDVLINGLTVSVQTDQINFLQLIEEVNSLLAKLWKMLGSQTSKLFDLFCLSISKKNIIWEVMFDSSRQLKKVSSITELLVMFLRYGLKASKASGAPRPLFLNPQVCEAISKDFRTGHRAAQDTLNRVLAALEPDRLKSSQFTIRGLNTSSNLAGRPALSRATSIQLARNDSRLLTLPALEIPESLRVDQVLSAQEVVEVFKFLEAGKLIVAELKADHYRASFLQVATGIEKVGETRQRISESFQAVHKVWLRPFKADPADHLPVKLLAAKPPAADESRASQGFIDPGLAANNGLLRDFAESLAVNAEYSPEQDISRFVGFNPSLNR